jgi:AmmeMemoRadiSam system protein A
MLSPRARARLHAIALAAVRAAARGSDPEVEAPAGEVEILRPSGAFVTLRRRGTLRGCIGVIPAARPMWETVRDMAVAAAVRDPRFPPVEPEEVDDLRVEISVLAPLRRIRDVEEVAVGRDGLYVVRGALSGLLLPQVATEQGWDRESFLDHTCVKAGLPRDAWRDPETELHAFEAEVF